MVKYLKDLYVSLPVYSIAHVLQLYAALCYNHGISVSFHHGMLLLFFDGCTLTPLYALLPTVGFMKLSFEENLMVTSEFSLNKLAVRSALASIKIGPFSNIF
jgi:hypothetical protein